MPESGGGCIVWSRELFPLLLFFLVCGIVGMTDIFGARPLDSLTSFETATQAAQGMANPGRYAVSQALDQEYQKYLLQQNADARQVRYRAADGGSAAQASVLDAKNPASSATEVKTAKLAGVKRDFFGRIIDNVSCRPGSSDGRQETGKQEEGMVWVSFHEGASTAVRKPITLEELIRGFF